jgi:hypothetical protein
MSKPGDTTSASRRLNVVLSERDYETIKRLACAQASGNVSDVVRQALKVGLWYQMEIAGTGKKLLIDEGSDQPLKELAFVL